MTIEKMPFVSPQNPITAEYLRNNGLAENCLDNVAEQDQRFEVCTRWILQNLEQWNSEQKSEAANALITQCNSRGFAGLLGTSWDKTAAEKRAQTKLLDTFVVRTFEFLRAHNLVPTVDMYNSNRCDGEIQRGLFENLDGMGVLLPPNSPQAEHVWQVLFNNSTFKETLSQAQWLAERKIWGNFDAMDNHVDGDDTVLFLVDTEKSVNIVRCIDPDVLKPLLERKDAKGRTAMHRAAAGLLPDFVEFLIELGAQINPQDSKGKYPLDLIKRTTSRVQHFARIQELLGGVSNKTPEQILKQAVQTLDSVQLNKLIDGKSPDEISVIAFDVLKQPITNTSTSVYKKMRARKMETFLSVLERLNPNAVDAEGNTLLHEAVKSGAMEVVDALLNKHPDLAGVSNTLGQQPSEIVIRETHTINSVDVGRVQNWHEEMHRVRSVDTAKKLLKIYIQHNASLNEHSFPVMRTDEKANSALSKALLTQQLHSAGIDERHIKSKSKM